jgi:hypothetical protein
MSKLLALLATLKAILILECSGQTECRRGTMSSSFRALSVRAAGRWRARRVSGRGVRSVGRVPHGTGLAIYLPARSDRSELLG